MTTLNDVLTFLAGADQPDLNAVAAAHRERSRQVRRAGRQHAASGVSGWERGATVALQGLVPKYLNGTRATLTGRRKGTKFEVEFGPNVDPRAIHRFGRTAYCPATALRLVDAPPAQPTGDAATREKIRKLLAKADSTTFPFEAESLRMKAAELEAELDGAA